MELSVVLGPPGTGKTSYAARQAARAVEKYGGDRVLLLSLTRAAAAEIRSRDIIDVPDENIGTLHSHCFRLLDRPKIIKSKHLDQWNELYPQWRVSASFAEESEERDSSWFTEVELRRHRLETDKRDESFLTAWRQWQAEAQVSEFTSLIETVYRRQTTFHPQPAVIICDEQQDFSELEMAVVYRWAQDAEHLVLIGDPCQSLYGWRGASPRAMPDPTIRLKQSHRVPRAVWEEARQILPQAPDDVIPREEEGSVDNGPSRYDHRYYVELMEESPIDESWMFLFSCQYMADAFAAALRADLVPYWNPFDPRRWNPLKLSTQRGVTGAARVQAFLCDWSQERVALWKPLFAHVFERGADEVLSLLRPEDPPRAVREAVLSVTKPEHRGWLGDLDPVEAKHWLSAQHQRAVFLLELGAKHGLSAFNLKPQAIVGTIHSVKGGEADHVVLFPDLSPRQWDQLQEPGWENRDAVLRTFYVGATRARKSLIRAIPAGGHHL